MCMSSAESRLEGSNPPSSVPKRAARPRPSRRLLFTIDNLQHEFGVSPGAPGPGSVIENAQPVAGRLTDRDVAWNQGVEDGFGEIAPHFIGDFVGQLERRVEHSE